MEKHTIGKNGIGYPLGTDCIIRTCQLPEGTGITEE